MSGDGQETSTSIVWSRSNVLPDNDKLFVTLVFYGCCWGSCIYSSAFKTFHAVMHELPIVAGDKIVRNSSKDNSNGNDNATKQ